MVLGPVVGKLTAFCLCKNVVVYKRIKVTAVRLMQYVPPGRSLFKERETENLYDYCG
jgi:hypothetical protein